jgi:hemerythrin-like domain-containing protein
MPDPVRQLEHTHGHLTKLVADLGASFRVDAVETADETIGLIRMLRDELMAHFADEEEALFPFIRASVADVGPAVDRLETAHEALAQLLGAALRLAEGERSLAPLRELHARFGVAYADHSVEEAALFDQLARRLGEEQRAELGRRLRGLRGAR